MFADCLIESAAHSNQRRRWTTLLSIALQSLALTLVIIIPMVIHQSGALKIVTLPGVPIFSVARKQPEAKPQPAAEKPHTETAAIREMVAPNEIPPEINMTPEPPA